MFQWSRLFSGQFCGSFAVCKSKKGCEILVVGDDAVDDAEEQEVDDSGIEGERLVFEERGGGYQRGQGPEITHLR